LASIEFTVNSKVHLATKVFPFITNYKRELRIEENIKRKRKIEKTIEFVAKMKQIQKVIERILK